MSSLTIQPLAQPPEAAVRVPGSKSLTNRALLAAALAEGKTCLTNALFSDDSHYFAAALQKLGFQVALEPDQHLMTVYGLGGHIPAPRAELFIGNAGTAARFLTAMVALGKGEYILDGETRMRERPIGDLVRAMRSLGVDVSPVLPSAGEEIYPPLRITANGIPGGKVGIAGYTSSQFLSGLLLAAPYAKGPVEIYVTGHLNSRPYVDMTISLMGDFGVQVERSGYEWFRIQPQRYNAQAEYVIEPDASAAAYFFAVPAICGGIVMVENITRASPQGDMGFLDVLAQIGCSVKETSAGIQVSRPTVLRGVDIDMRDIPDTAQTLAAIAPFASTPTTIRGIASARLKESDRIAATCTELRRLGVTVEEHPDGMTIFPCQSFTPASIRTYNDHRMAMAFALIGLRVEGVRIEDPDCVAKTFPEFFQVLESLRKPRIIKQVRE